MNRIKSRTPISFPFSASTSGQRPLAEGRSRRNAALAICALFLFAGCSASSTGEGDGMAGGLGPDGGAISDEDLGLSGANRFGDGNIPAAQAGGLFDDIFFDYDSAAVPPQYHEQLRENANVLSSDPSL
ncbi:MAG: hypothetical protein KDD69_10190, partial [Bdellovibrionales bacterium]|nr:hypothetical protein [Bdellovibrionales bacterium]